MPDRFASISTLLPTRPVAEPVEDEQSEAAPATSSPEAPAPAPAAARPGPQAVPPRTRAPRKTATEQPRPRASDAADGGTRRVAFRLDPGLHQQLSERAAQTRTSKGNVVLDAIEDAHDADALAPAAPQAARTGLFARTQDRGPAAPTVLVEIRLTSQAVQTLDQLVARTKQPTRTQLIHAALAHHFRQTATAGDTQP